MTVAPARGSLFDFDGTLFTGDTMVSFLWGLAQRSGWHFVPGLLYVAFAAPWWALGVKRRAALSGLLWVLTAGRSSARRDALLREGSDEIVASGRHRPRVEVIDQLTARHAAGEEIWIVTGSCREWVQTLLERHGVPHHRIVDSELDVRGGGLTLRSRCVGREKRRRVQALTALRPVRWCAAYGDQPSDRYVMGLAEEQHWV